MNNFDYDKVVIRSMRGQIKGFLILFFICYMFYYMELFLAAKVLFFFLLFLIITSIIPYFSTILFLVFKPIMMIFGIIEKDNLLPEMYSLINMAIGIGGTYYLYTLLF